MVAGQIQLTVISYYDAACPAQKTVTRLGLNKFSLMHYGLKGNPYNALDAAQTFQPSRRDNGRWGKTPDQGYYPIGTRGLLLISGALPAMAGGFTQPKGFSFTALGVTYDTDSYHKLEIQAYVEHGLQDNLTLILKSPYDWIEDNEEFQGFTDQEVGFALATGVLLCNSCSRNPDSTSWLRC